MPVYWKSKTHSLSYREMLTTFTYYKPKLKTLFVLMAEKFTGEISRGK